MKARPIFRYVFVLALLVTSCKVVEAFNIDSDIGPTLGVTSPVPTPEITGQPTVSASEEPGDESGSPTRVPATAQATPSVLAVFPGAEGFGTTTPAGSGRNLYPPRTTVYKVTNLNVSGSGSLGECVYASGPRVCVFEVSGTIEIDRQWSITDPYLTIAGQTAPSPGITLKGVTLVIKTHDVLIQHVRIRVGDRAGYDPNNRDGIGIENDDGARDVYNVVIDHCSISWAIDGNVDLWFDGVRDITISNSIISEALHDSLHPEGPHSTALLIGKHVQRVSVHHSLLAHNHGRNPYIQADTTTELVNNVYYNWGEWGFTRAIGDEDEDPLFCNIIGNYYKPGLDSPQDRKPIQIYGPEASKLYVEDNIGPGRESDAADDWDIVMGDEDKYRSYTPTVTRSVLTTHSARQAYDFVLNNAGARPADRDPVDVRTVDDVRNGTGRIIDSQDDVGGWPGLAENYRKLTLPSDLNGDDDGNGYTNLEEWLHTLAAEVEGQKSFNLRVTPSTQAIDPGCAAIYDIEVQPIGQFTHTVTLNATSPSSRLSINLRPTTINPSGKATLIVRDTVPDPHRQGGEWYRVPITATGGDVTRITDANLLVGGTRVYLSLTLREDTS